VLIPQCFDDISHREAADKTRFDLRRKPALSLSLDDRGFHFGTLSRARSRLSKHGQERYAFEALLRLALETGLLTRDAEQVIDSPLCTGQLSCRRPAPMIPPAVLRRPGSGIRRGSSWVFCLAQVGAALPAHHLDGTLGVEGFRRERGEREAQATGRRMEQASLRRELASLDREMPEIDPDACIAFAQEMVEGLEVIGKDLAARKRVIELLHVHATVRLEADGQRWLDAQCVVGSAALQDAARSCTSSTGDRTKGATPFTTCGTTTAKSG